MSHLQQEAELFYVCCASSGADKFFSSPDKSMRRARKRSTAAQVLLDDILATGNFTLQDIAAKTGLTLATVRRISKGVVKNPHADVFDRIFELHCAVCIVKKF